MHIKKLEQPFLDLGMKVNTHHTFCPAHGGSDSVSCNILSNGHIVWSCKSCGEGGSIIDAWCHAHNMTKEEAIEDLAIKYGSEQPVKVPERAPRPKTEEKPQLFSGQFHPPEKMGRYSSIVHRIGDRTVRLRYSDAKKWVAPCRVNGKIMSPVVFRWDLPGGEKVIRQGHYDGEEWKMEGYPHRPAPLYNEGKIDQSEIVFVVEGETCMDALQLAIENAQKKYEDSFPQSVAVTTIVGGSARVSHANLDVLQGRDLYLLMDNDEPGEKMMRYIQKKMGGIIINLANEDSPRGYDVKDWLSDGGDVREIFRLSGLEPEEEEDNFVEEALELSASLELSEVTDFFRKLAPYKPNPMYLDKIFMNIKNSCDVNKTSIAQTWKQVQKEVSSVDWGLYVAESARKECYNNLMVYQNKMFWVYNDLCWVEVDENSVKNRMLNLIKKRVPSSEMDAEKVLKKSTYLIKTGSDMSHVDEDYLCLRKPPESIINLQNGALIVDRETGDAELVDHDPDHRLKFCVDAIYDPDATCPEYDKAIYEIFEGDEERIRHLHEVAGYLIQPYRNFKNFFLFYGPEGNNGKSKIKDLIVSIAGARNTLFFHSDSFGHGAHDTYGLMGKLLMVEDDMKKGTKLNDGLMKEISEQKLISANPKHKDTVQFISYAGILMCTNHHPITTDLTAAMISRAQIIPFYRKFTEEEADKELFNRITRNELSGVLNHFLAGLKRLRQRGHWDVPTSCRMAKEIWLNETSNLHLFSSLYFEQDAEAEVYATDIREIYNSFCTREHIAAQYQVQNRRLKQSLREIGFQVESANNNRGGWKIVGHRIKTDV